MSSEMEHAPACKLEFETRMVMSVRASTLRSPQGGIGLFSGRSPEQRSRIFLVLNSIDEVVAKQLQYSD